MFDFVQPRDRPRGVALTLFIYLYAGEGSHLPLLYVFANRGGGVAELMVVDVVKDDFDEVAQSKDGERGEGENEKIMGGHGLHFPFQHGA